MFLYAISAVIFLTLDAVMLTFVMKPLFVRTLGDAMRDSPLLVPAGIFYLGYVAGLVFIVSGPALRAADPTSAALRGAVVGAMAFGTYEFTSITIMKDWSWALVATDTIWGTILTGFVAWAGVAIILRLQN